MAEFIWLKPLIDPYGICCHQWADNRLPEVAGPFCHWLAERRLRRPLVVPMIQCAIDSLNEALASLL